MTRPSLLRRTRPLLAVAALLFFAACEAPTEPGADDSELLALSDYLATELSLAADQQQAVDGVMQRFGDREREPGTLWYVAAELQATLTDEEIADLLARTQSMREFQGMGPGRPFQPNGFQGSDGIETPAFGPMRGFGPNSGPRPNGGFGPNSGAGMQGGGPNGGPGMLGDGPNQGAFGGFGLIDDLLTDEQRAEQETIRATYRTERQALIEQRRAGELTEEAFREAMDALREAERAALDALLTDEQRDELAQRIEERKAAFEAWAEQVRAAMYDALDATDEQQSALDALAEEQRAAREALLEQLRAEEIDRATFGEEMAALKVAEAETLQDILDATQYEIVQIHDALTARRLRMNSGERRGGGPRGGGPAGGPGGDFNG